MEKRMTQLGIPRAFWTKPGYKAALANQLRPCDLSTDGVPRYVVVRPGYTQFCRFPNILSFQYNDPLPLLFRLAHMLTPLAQCHVHGCTSDIMGHGPLDRCVKSMVLLPECMMTPFQRRPHRTELSGIRKSRRLDNSQDNQCSVQESQT